MASGTDGQILFPTLAQIDQFILGTFPKVPNFRKGMMKTGLMAGNF